MQHWFIHTIDPVALNLFGLTIRWYGLGYLAGFLAAALILKIRTRIDTRYPPDMEVSDFLLYAAIGTIVGGRLGEVFFYNARFYLDHLIQIFFLWKGGMASHGGMIGVIMATVLFAWKRRIDPFVLLDDVALATPPGLCFGRMANFINSEMVGSVTDAWWAVIFPRYDLLPRHPAQLYQAIAEGPVLLAFLLAGLKLKMRPGGLGCVFLIGYGLLRCLTENFREVDPGYLGYWHGLTNGQLLSLGMIPLGILYLAIASWFHRPAARAFGSRP